MKRNKNKKKNRAPKRRLYAKSQASSEFPLATQVTNSPPTPTHTQKQEPIPKRKGRMAYVLFFIGIASAIGSLFVNNIDHIPIVRWLVSRTYSFAAMGYDQLKTKGKLNQDDIGFDVIADLAGRQLTVTKQKVRPHQIESFSRSAGGVFLGGQEPVPRYYVHYSPTETDIIDGGQLEKNIAKIKDGEKARNALALGILGIVLQILGFFFKK